MGETNGRLIVRAFAQPVTFLGVAMLVCIFGAMFYLLEHDRKAAENTALQSNEALGLLLEFSVQNTFDQVETQLAMLEARHLSGSITTDTSQSPMAMPALQTPYLVSAIVGPDRKLIWANGASADVTALVESYAPDASDFSAEPERMIVRGPILLGQQAEALLIFSRAMRNAQGDYLGATMSALDLTRMPRARGLEELSKAHIAIIARQDGVVLLAFVGGQVYPNLIGERIPVSSEDTMKSTTQARSDWYELASLDTETAQGGRGTRYFMWHEAVEALPLVAVVGTSEAQVFSVFNHNASVYYFMATLLSVAIVLAMGVGVRRQLRLDRLTRSLEKANSRLEAVLLHMPHGVCMFDSSLNLILANSRYATMYGLSPELAKPGTSLQKIVTQRVERASEEEAREYVEKQMRIAALPEPVQTATTLPDGRTFMVSHQPMIDGGTVAVHQDITEQRHTEQQIWRLAHFDELTGLPNRVEFADAMKRALTNYKKNGVGFAVHILDLDHFKEVNDTLGHPTGDALLIHVAERLRMSVPKGCVVARLGGDEFALVHSLEKGKEAAERMARRCVAAIAEVYDLNDHRLVVEASIGIALAPEHGTETEDLMRRADLALYKAKSSGRNNYQIFDAAIEDDAISRRVLVAEMQAALTKEQFEIFYQPIVDAIDTEIVGMEALVRWRHPERGLVAPDIFISLAEDTGLIEPLGRWILRRACADAQTWPTSVKLAVNLSPVQFMKAGLVDDVANALAASGLDPNRLELEITESVLLENDQQNLATLRQLQALGASISLDDFGTGYSSLSYLRSFAFDKIKIDRSFVRELGQDQGCEVIISAVTSIARGFNIITTAEGVETKEQLAVLRAAGCNQIQGYLFGKPTPAYELDFEQLRQGRRA